MIDRELLTWPAAGFMIYEIFYRNRLNISHTFLIYIIYIYFLLQNVITTVHGYFFATLDVFDHLYSSHSKTPKSCNDRRILYEIVFSKNIQSKYSQLLSRRYSSIDTIAIEALLKSPPADTENSSAFYCPSMCGGRLTVGLLGTMTLRDILCIFRYQRKLTGYIPSEPKVICE